MKPFAFLDSKRRFTALCICMVVIVAGVFLRLIWLQVVQADQAQAADEIAADGRVYTRHSARTHC